MALAFVHGKCQHYYESGQTRWVAMAPARGLENSAWYPFSNPYSSAALPGRHGLGR